MPNFSKFSTCLLGLSAFTFANAAVTCITAAAPLTVRSEGLAERAGDVVLQCTGAATDAIRGNLHIFLPVNVTNHLAADGSFDDIVVTTHTGGAESTLGVKAYPFGASGVSINDLNIPLPGGMVFVRVSNLRIAPAQRPLGLTGQLFAQISTSQPNSPTLSSPHLAVAVPLTGLLASSSAAMVNCYGSPLPETVTITKLFETGTRAFSTRVTEGYAAAFEKDGPQTSVGTRIVIRYSGFPAGAKLLVPDAIAGTSAVRSTSAGDLTTPRSGGQYAVTPQGSLLLSRVLGADAKGAGGTLAFTPPAPGSDPVTLDAASEVQLANGAGIAVYEVVDANPSVQESAELPTFLGLPRTNAVGVSPARTSVALGPLSDVAVASATAPIPRFADITPPLDCTVRGDCDAFPKLHIDTPRPFRFTAQAGGKRMSEWATVNNIGGGNLAWTSTVTYRNGSGWIELYTEPNRGLFSGWFRVTVDPARLAPGTYEATLAIDAGPTAGSGTVPIVLVVNPAAQAAGPKVNAVVHSASFAQGPVAPGSIASVFGSGLKGNNVSVTFDGIAATLLYVDDGLINLHVPPELGLRSSAQMVVRVDGIAGAAATVNLTQAAPAVFSRGLLNQDNSVNAPDNPAAAGSVLITYLTGLPAAADAGMVTARIGDREVTAIEYAGPAPTLTGVQLVNVRTPADLSAGTVDFLICFTDATSAAKTCSPAVRVSIK